MVTHLHGKLRLEGLRALWRELRSVIRSRSFVLSTVEDGGVGNDSDRGNGGDGDGGASGGRGIV